MNSTIINTKLGDIEYRSIGKGIPVVFIHGGHSNCYETLGHKGFDLSKFRLIIPSRPGYGRTPLNGKKTPKEAADLIIEILNYLSIDKAIIYGISAGGLTAIELAANYPTKVEKLLLASAISKKWLNEDGKIYKTAQLIFNPKIERLTWGMVRLFSGIFPRMIAKSFYPQFSTDPAHKLTQEDIQELVLALKHYRSKRGFINDIDQDINDGTITKINCPCLIVHSKNDNSVSFEHPIHSNDMIKNSRLIELDNEWGHLFWIGKDSEQSIKKTVEFINE
ncbi:alpha/beta hydrolase [Algoriphagus sp. D3-2-R+10]|uniref:alpha/beta fold hydrolase n=1 Tax=Algoriphagus aurantiacus TaxID=3103948 RepID=UPI002B3A9C17|nr:alpha/beta hydrolase [Algoriphagus sp. D3-2-R+10]MEB2777836.1 alpha/beta hydrolase [Algoriphagus sp. D3-2-R+10]